MKKILICLELVTILTTGAAFAGDSASADSKVGYKSSGYVFWENFRLWKADYNGTTYKGDWFNSILGGFVLENTMSDNLRTRVALESRFTRPFPEEQGQSESRITKFDSYVHEAKAVYTFGDVARPKNSVEVGYFLYDYNKDQHDLGEYLFRSKMYPTAIFTDFELPMDRLLGIRWSNRPFQGFHEDVLLTSSYKDSDYPKSDYSLSYLADINFGGVLELGGGVMFAHYLSVVPSKETPGNDNNTYVQIPVQGASAQGTPAINTPVAFFKSDLQAGAVPDSIAYRPDTNSQAFSIRPGIQYTETKFSYKGIKAMGRFSFDPKPLLGSPSILGSEDLKLYGEVAVLGVKDYPLLYPSIKQRMPVMVGLDLPAFRLLDVIGIEAEYCANKFPDNWQKSFANAVPQPGDANFSPFANDRAANSKDDWKWAVYLRKQLSRGLYISAQAASDHLRLADKSGSTFQSLMKDTGVPFTGEWWGIIRVTASY